MLPKTIVLAAFLMSYSANSATSTDNTKVNKPDQAKESITANQQSFSTNDTNITRRIRQDIMKQENLSTYAQNIKIVTVNGKVTLKGPVRTEKEQSSILDYARSIAGASNVTNEMSVVPE
jgi:hyperosmotically inducible protein